MMLLIVTASSAIEVIVRYRNPPRRRDAGWVQGPDGSGAETGSTPSKVVFADGYEESSDALVRTNNGDSEKDRLIALRLVEGDRFSVMSPPT